MSLIVNTAALLALASVAVASPFANPMSHQMFSVNQHFAGTRLKNGPADLVRAVAKFATTDAPSNVLAAAAAVQSGSVSAIPESYDTEYLCPVTVGSQTLMLDFDTGSSDLWVFSTLTPTSQQTGHSLYAPTGNATGQTWKISYGDGSGASGTVYADSVVVGSVTATSQAVEAATSVASSFTDDTDSDGLLGLGFGALNTCSPNKCTTFFDTVKSSLASALFTVTLKKGAAGTYDFGYVDSSKYAGAITYTPVNPVPGYWTFTSSGYAVGSGAPNNTALITIADTGTSLIYMPTALLTAYYSQVAGAQNSHTAGGYIFPCSSVLPSLTFFINGYAATVPGSYMNYAPYEGSSCFGGLQSSASVGLNILGDIFLKSQFVVFDQTQATPRLGFAAQPGLATYSQASSAASTTTSTVSSVVSSRVVTTTSIPAPVTLTTVSSTLASSTTSTSTPTSISKSASTSTSTITSLSANPSATVSPLSCPSSNGTTFTTANGDAFTIECSIDHPGGDLSSSRTTTFDACLTSCSVTAGCVAVSWVPGSPGFCYLHSTLTAATSNDNVWGAVLKSVAPTSTSSSVAAPTTVPTISCPASNGTTITSNAETFQVQCSIDHVGGDSSVILTSSLNACVVACASANGCVAVSWVPGTPTGACWMKTSLKPGVANSGVWGAARV